MSGILLIIGYLLLFIGGLLFLVEMFKESILWGLGGMFISPVSLIFLIMHWDAAKRPFLLQLCSIPFILGAVALA